MQRVLSFLLIRWCGLVCSNSRYYDHTEEKQWNRSLTVSVEFVNPQRFFFCFVFCFVLFFVLCVHFYYRCNWDSYHDFNILSATIFNHHAETFTVQEVILFTSFTNYRVSTTAVVFCTKEYYGKSITVLDERYRVWVWSIAPWKLSSW